MRIGNKVVYASTASLRLTNAKLFTEVRANMCGTIFHDEELTREHIIPFTGIDTWMNVVTACRACNHRKKYRAQNRRTCSCSIPVLPSLWEILRNRRILADQMEFLMAHVPQIVPLDGVTWRACDRI
jgi:hypothetical protein